MSHQFLADLVLLLHLAWIVFILAGLLLARRRPWLAWLHLGALLTILILSLGGWYCPLTLLEYHLRSCEPASPGYPGSFLFTWLERLIYLRVPESWLRLAGAAWAMVNLAGHVYLLGRRRRQ